MSDQLQIFENEEFGKVRVLEINGQPWFVGKDITDVLQYGNSRQALKTNVDDEDKGVHSVDTLGGKQKITIINESGLYALILSSKLPSAKRFKRWVTSEVLPTLRRHGAYLTEDTLEAALGSQEFTLTLLRRLQAEHGKTEALRSRVEELVPKARYYDCVLMSGQTVPVSIIAKDYGMTAVAFNRLLHHLASNIGWAARGCCTSDMPETATPNPEPTARRTALVLFTPAGRRRGGCSCMSFWRRWAFPRRITEPLTLSGARRAWHEEHHNR